VLGADRDDLAGHVAGVVAGQEDHHVGHLPGLGGPAERLPAGQLGEQVLAGHLGQERVDGQAGRDRVDPDAVRGDVQRGAPGEGHHAGLGRRVVRLAGLGAPAQDRGVVDDRSAVPLGDEPAQRRPGAAERPVQRDVEHPRPLLVGHVEHRGGAAEPGVVDHHVDPAEVPGRAVDQRGHLRLVGDVAASRPDPVAVRPGELVARRGQPFAVLVADYHAGAFFQAAPGGGAADAGAGRGGDHHHLAVQQPVPGHRVPGHGGAHERGRPSARVAMMSCWISSEPP
jgi:hypothetical protein